MTALKPLLRVEGLSAGYGSVQVLHDVSLEVYRGEVVTVLGSNGAGKTTSLLCMSRILPLLSGKVFFDDEDITPLPPHIVVNRGLSQVPEGRKIFPRLTVLENLELGAFCRSRGDDVAKDIERMYSLFPILAERHAQLGGTLSGGEQQMLAIARALMSRPKLLLMDEPSMGVAPLLVEKIFDTLRELTREGLTILLVEQNAHLALQLATRGYVIETGSIVLTASAEALRCDEKVREAYLGE